MAFGAQQISPIDFNKSAAVGVNLPFSSPTAFASNYTTQEAIKNNLLNFFLTNPGERPLNPGFGGGLRSFIFEQITDGNLDFLKTQIDNKLKFYFPNITIQNLKISEQLDNNIINVILNYKVKNTNIIDTLQIDFA
jgi:phage baseplate assembly protein W